VPLQRAVRLDAGSNRPCWYPLLAVVVTLAASGCGGGTPTPPPEDNASGMGSIQASVRLVTSEGLTVTKVHISVMPAGVTQDLTYDPAEDQYTGLITAPVGTQTVTATAFAGGLLVGTGSATATVTKHGTAAITIKILDNASPGRAQDHGPIIASMSASTLTPMVGDTVTLQVTALDADGDPVAYQWSQDCGGTFGTPNAPTSTWLSNAATPCVITALVTSKGISDTAHVTISVQAATGGMGLSAIFIAAPYVSRVALSGSGLSCTVPRDASDASCRPAIARGSVLTASVTFDPMPADSGGDVVLADSCGGSSVRTALNLLAGTAAFTWTAPATSGSCILSATASREGLTDAERVAIALQ
jgi:hypothetical protein